MKIVLKIKKDRNVGPFSFSFKLPKKDIIQDKIDLRNKKLESL